MSVRLLTLHRLLRTIAVLEMRGKGKRRKSCADVTDEQSNSPIKTQKKSLESENIPECENDGQLKISAQWLNCAQAINALKVETKKGDRVVSALEKNEDDGSYLAPIVAVCGPRNAGKSSFCLYMVEMLLKRYPIVAFLETDIGQPEFTIPGVVALNMLTQPVSGPPHSHLLEPFKFHYFGDVNPKSHPEFYLRQIFDLFEEFKKNFCLPEGQVGGKESRKTVPLVINTHGWIKGVGFDVLVQILQYICPTHVVKISGTSANKGLPGGAFWEKNFSSGSTEIFHIDPVENIKNFPTKSPLESRNLRILAHFFPLAFLEGQDSPNLNDFTEAQMYLKTAEALMKVRPYRVPISSIQIVHFHDEAPKSKLLYIVNASLVVLASRKENLNSNVGEFDHYNCIGFGIVRSVDVSKNLFYVLSPLPLEKIKKVNVFLHGKIGLPPRMLTANGISSPYLAKDGFSLDVIGSHNLKSRNNLKRRSLT